MFLFYCFVLVGGYLFYKCLNSRNSKKNNSQQLNPTPRSKKDIDPSGSIIRIQGAVHNISELVNGEIRLLNYLNKPFILTDENGIQVQFARDGDAPEDAFVKNTDEGVYEINFTPMKVGKYRVTGTIVIGDNTYRLPATYFFIRPGPIDPKQIIVKNINHLPHIIDSMYEFLIETFDTHGNKRTSGGDSQKFTVRDIGDGKILDTFVVSDNENGTYTIFYTTPSKCIQFINIFFEEIQCLSHPLCICVVNHSELKEAKRHKAAGRLCTQVKLYNGDEVSSTYISITGSQLSIQKYKRFFGFEFLPDTLFSSRIPRLRLEFSNNELILRDGIRRIRLGDESIHVIAALILLLKYENQQTYDQRIYHLKASLRKNVPFSSATVFSTNRDKLLSEALEIGKSKSAFWRSLYQIRFIGEEGIDSGGLYKEYFNILPREVFTSKTEKDIPIFSVEMGYVYFNPKATSTYAKSVYYLAGVLLGKVIYDQCMHSDRNPRIPTISLSPLIYKLILQLPIEGEDLVYSEEYNSRYEFIKKYDLNEDYIQEQFDDLVFAVEEIKLEKGKQRSIWIPLKSNGESMKVKDENKDEYLELLARFIFQKKVTTQVDTFLKGFYSIIPFECISHLDIDDLQLLLCGVCEINLKDMKKHCVLYNWSPNDREIQWFWEAVSTLTAIQRSKLLGFVTGSTTLPFGGFSVLSPKFTIMRSNMVDKLPITHTCFNIIELPRYTNYQKLLQSLTTAITFGSEGFAMA